MAGLYSGAYGATYAPWASTGANVLQQPPAMPMMAANQSARLWGDPHIDAANGGKYDFQQTGIFNLLSDQGINLNGLTTQKPGSNVTYDTEAGLAVGDNLVHFYGDGRVDIGEAQYGAVPADLQDGRTYSFGSNATIRRSGDSYTVATPEYNVQVDANQNDNGLKYLNLKVASGDNGVASDGVAPTGLLGETFNAADAQQTDPEYSPEAYQAQSLFSLPGEGTSDSSSAPSGNETANSAVSTTSASFVWALADANGDGNLDPTELQNAAVRLQDGNPQHEAMAQLMMEMLNGTQGGQSLFPDFNQDGGISFDEINRVASLDGDSSTLSQADLNQLAMQTQPVGSSASGQQPDATAGGLGLPQMLVQVFLQAAQLVLQLLQANGAAQ